VLRAIYRGEGFVLLVEFTGKMSGTDAHLVRIWWCTCYRTSSNCSIDLSSIKIDVSHAIGKSAVLPHEINQKGKKDVHCRGCSCKISIYIRDGYYECLSTVRQSMVGQLYKLLRLCSTVANQVITHFCTVVLV
jgi:hypothetical protein